MNRYPYVWTGAEAEAVPAYHPYPPIPPITELLAGIHALDAEIHQADREIAGQVTMNNLAFVEGHWRPFVDYWDRSMREVDYYEHNVFPKDPPGVARVAMVFWAFRARYHTLRQEAVANWGFALR